MHTSILLLAAAPAGATRLAVRPAGEAMSAKPGQGLLIGSIFGESFEIVAIDGAHLEIKPPLPKALAGAEGVGFGATLYPSQVEAGDVMIGLISAEAQRMRTALVRAQETAARTETERAEAEQRHAAAVADALMSGAAMPAKPAALSAAQANDDATDAAVDLIARRSAELDQLLQLSAGAEVSRRLRRLYEVDAAAAWDALRAVARDIAALVDAVGSSQADAFVQDIMRHLPTGLGDARLRRIDVATAALRPHANVSSSGGSDLATAAGWPTNADAAHLAKEITP